MLLKLFATMWRPALQQITGLRRDASRPQAYRHHQNARALELFPAGRVFASISSDADS
jgi:hypothetical protein